MDPTKSPTKKVCFLTEGPLIQDDLTVVPFLENLGWSVIAHDWNTSEDVDWSVYDMVALLLTLTWIMLGCDKEHLELHFFT